MAESPWKNEHLQSSSLDAQWTWQWQGRHRIGDGTRVAMAGAPQKDEPLQSFNLNAKGTLPKDGMLTKDKIQVSAAAARWLGRTRCDSRGSCFPSEAESMLPR